MKQLCRAYALPLAFLTAVAAAAGSLYFSEVLHLPPCVLCWYQRIAMYPLVVILLTGMLLNDKRVHLYALPFAFGGWLIGVYQSLLYYGIIPESGAPCTAGASCTTRYLDWFGFIDIPQLSVLAFTFIIIALICWKRSEVIPQQKTETLSA